METQQFPIGRNFALDFASLVNPVINKYIEAMSKVCGGLRGDAFVLAQEVDFDNLCEIVDGRHADQQHARNGFPFE